MAAVPVYDILNCGPRHRFVANGRLVHNSINTQNLTARGVGSSIRHGLTAPPGCVIMVYDLSGIELRMNMLFSGQLDVLDYTRRGGDPYIQEAAAQFERTIHEYDHKSNKRDKQERNFGKVIRLGAQYGMGPPKFRVYVATGPMGIEPMYLTELQARNTIGTYRANHPRVKASWDFLTHQALPIMSGHKPHTYSLIELEHERIRLPTGLTLTYPNLRATEDGWIWGMQGRQHHTWGGTIQENVVQALAGTLIKENMTEIDRLLEGERFVRGQGGLGAVVHQVHDEILVVCPEDKADEVQSTMSEVMTTPPWWAPDLPLAVEGGYDTVYSK